VLILVWPTCCIYGGDTKLPDAVPISYLVPMLVGQFGIGQEECFAGVIDYQLSHHFQYGGIYIFQDGDTLQGRLKKAITCG